MNRQPVARLAALILTTILLITGCQNTSAEQEATSADANRATVADHTEDLSIVAGDTAQVLAAEAATTFFAEAPYVFAAQEEDRDVLALLSDAAYLVQAPLLVVGAENQANAAALEQLSTTKVFVANDLSEEQREQLSTSGRQLIDIRAETEDGTVELDQEELAKHFYREIPAQPVADESAKPTKRPVQQLTKRLDVGAEGADTLAAIEDKPKAVAAATTALAARVPVIPYTGDPRGNDELISAAGNAKHLLAVTTADARDANDLFATVATGVQLPGGGQLVFDGKRYVALYGSPLTPSLGLLGEQGTAATIKRAAEYTAEYDGLFGKDKAVPALEIIVTVASAGAGKDGNYSEEWDSKEFLPLVKAAEKAGQYVVLDFQPGRTEFVKQIKLYEDLLKYPHVGVALDPEWRIGDNERHLARIGHVDAAEVNDVIDYLADFTKKHRLPQKALVLHQFQVQMLRDRDQIKLDDPEVAVLIHADGQGSQGEKNATWDALHQDAPKVAWGWKNFIDEDRPMLTPEQTVKIKPLPHFVSYQ